MGKDALFNSEGLGPRLRAINGQDVCIVDNEIRGTVALIAASKSSQSDQ